MWMISSVIIHSTFIGNKRLYLVEQKFNLIEFIKNSDKFAKKIGKYTDIYICLRTFGIERYFPDC